MNTVAVVIESMGGGGAQQVVASLLSHWLATGRNVDLFTFQGPETDAYRIPSQVQRTVIGGSRPSRGLLDAILANIRRLITLRSALRASSAKTIVAFISTTNIITILATFGLGRRIIVSERNDPQRQKLPFMWALLRRLTYPLADVVTANSPTAVTAMGEMRVGRNAVYLPNPLRQAPSVEVAPKSGPLLLAVGRLHPQKGYDTLLAAFAEARPAMRDWTLRILGSGPLDSELRAMAERLSLPVEFLGYVSDPFPHYRSADLFVLASRYEGSPNALWEAMSCGVPVIVPDSLDGVLGIVVDGESGLVVKGDDVSSLARAMVTLAVDAPTRTRLGNAARDAVQCFAPADACAAWDRVVFSR